LSRTLVKTRRVGGSIVVRIPKELVEEHIHAGELVELEVKKARKDWFGALPNLLPFSRAEELDVHD
jgi:hypothetical protein